MSKQAAGRLWACWVLLALLAGCVQGGEGPSGAGVHVATPVTAPPTPIYTQVLVRNDIYAVIAREYLSLRTRPDASSARIKKLEPGAIVSILQEAEEFAYVEEIRTGERGYALRKYLVALPMDIALPTPAPPRSPGTYRVAAEEFLTLRQQADTASQTLTTLPSGALVNVLSFQGSFAQVEVQGMRGYLLASYLEPMEPVSPGVSDLEAYKEAGEVYIVSLSQGRGAGLRAQPREDAQRLITLAEGDRLSVLSWNEGNGYALVEMEATGERGYIRVGGDLTLLPSLEYTSPDAQDIRYVDAMEYLTLRKEPSTAAEAVGRLNRGEEVVVLERTGDFARVTSAKSGQQGYVLDGYLSAQIPKVSAQQGELYAVLAQEYLSLRKEPSTEAQRIEQIPAGARVSLDSFDGLFAKVGYQGKEGYVLSGYIKPEGDGLYEGLSIVRPAAQYTPPQLYQDLEALAAKYPGRIRLQSAGTTALGRDIPVVLLGNPQAQRHVLIQAGIHAREYMTTLLAAAQIEYILSLSEDALYQGQAVSRLLEESCLHILPSTNPDGAWIAQTGATTPAIEAIYQSDAKAERAEEPLKTYLTQWKANAGGVDLNRNFDAGWRKLGGPEGPSFTHFKGNAPADQPESAALCTYTDSYDFDATISYHAYGSVLYWEYGSHQRVLDASRSLARAVRGVTRYPLAGSGGLDAGGYKDWAMEVMNIPSLTIEIGTRPCPLPLDEFHTIYQRNRDVPLEAMRWALEEAP